MTGNGGPAGLAGIWAEDEDQAALRFVHAHPGAALCTIAGIAGSFSRRLGAQLAVASDGTTHGSLADGCLERELASQVAHRAGDGPAVLRYGRGSPFVDFRLPCGSGLDVLIDPHPDRAAIAQAVRALDAREPAALPLPVPADQPGLLALRPFVPRLELVVLGSGPEAAWLGRVAEGLGIACRTAGPDAGLQLGQPPQGLRADAWTAIVLLFHDHAWEAPLLDWALDTPALYIGAIGGQVARESRIAQLRRRGLNDAALARVRSPVGLIRQARDARVLAVSIVAAIIEAYECARPDSH